MKKILLTTIVIMAVYLLCGCARLKKGQANIANNLVVDEYPGVSMSLTEVTPISATCILKNDSNTDLIYGESYIIQECRDDGEWYYRESASTDEYGHIISIPAIGYDLVSKTENTIEHNWNVIYGELLPGKYRIIKDFHEDNADKSVYEYYVSCEFEIKE